MSQSGPEAMPVGETFGSIADFFEFEVLLPVVEGSFGHGVISPGYWVRERTPSPLAPLPIW